MSTATITGIVLLVFGFILVGVEIYLPGFGVPGISGIACLVIGVFLTAKTMEQAFLFTIIVIVILAVMLTIFILVIRSKRVSSTIILNDELKNNPEYIGEEDLKYLISKEGVALTDLRPFGRGSFDGIVLDVKSSDGKFIKHDTRIKIVGIKDKTLSVERI